jgi:NADH-quinone oxidoreductase subunit F
MSDITYLPGKEPHENEHRLIFKNVDRKGWDPKIRTYLAEGGYEMAMKALKMKPQEVIDEVKASGLRGRGGAGFPTGIKWGFIPPNNTKPVYLICNCDESEPGTFKDRYIVHQDPHQLIEGMVISAYAVGAHVAYIYIREEFQRLPSFSKRPSPMPRRTASLVRIFKDRDSISKSTFIVELPLTFAERRPV